MVNEVPDTYRVEVVIAAEGERFAHQIGTALRQGVVAAFHMGRLARLLADRTMPFGGDDLGVGFPEIARAQRTFAVVGWERVPQLPSGCC